MRAARARARQGSPEASETPETPWTRDVTETRDAAGAAEAAERGDRAGRGRASERDSSRTRPGQRSRPEPRMPGERPQGRTPDPVAGERARAVRDLLAGAFRMPPDEPTDEPSDEWTDQSIDPPTDRSADPSAAQPTDEPTGPDTDASPGAGPGRAPSPASTRDTAPGAPARSALSWRSAAPAPARPAEPHAPSAASESHVTDPGGPSRPGPSPTTVGAKTEGAHSAPSPTARPSGSHPDAAPNPPSGSHSEDPPTRSSSTPPSATAPPTSTPPTGVGGSAPGRAPRSMAAPSRDGDHRRTFPPFPPRTGGSFAETWWGNAWVAALEEGALDAKRLVRGRGYAEQGNVDAITVTPGLVLGYVQGSRPRPYRVQVRLRTLGGDAWERFLDAAVERPGHIAALLDKEMPESLADCGVPLLPGPGDLEPQCSCPDRGHPCKHAAALCYQTARLLDADPFVLLLLRGRGEREVLDALSRRNAVRAARAAQEQDRQPEPLEGVRAAQALAERRLPPLPDPLPPPAHPEQPPAYPSAPNGPDAFALDHLATDAAARAHALLTTGRDEIGGLTLWQDAVRLAASRPGSGLTAATRSLYASLASAAGRTPAELARAVAAWRQGGPDGLTVLEESWDPPAGRFDRARPLLLAADLPAFRPRRNHLTHPRGHVQLRYGQDGLWYAYESEPGHDDWWPRGTPDSDPVGALTGLGGPDEL
ncbi:SWIM zinc finger family protein [Streptomyces sp. IBSBF 2807]|nr:SWIM zinc finger family protein [Streptomyces hilarionis]